MSQDHGTSALPEGSLGAGAGPSYHPISLTWPVLLITLGLMLLADQFAPGWNFHRTWPVLLVVFGVLKLIDSGRPPRPPAGPRI
jgi:Domain of unknown function (DUF5668)